MAEVRLEIDLVHPSVRVWRALTDARLLSSWFMPTDLAPREGSRFTLEPGTLPGFLGPVAGELVELAAPRRLVALWQGEKLYTRMVWELASTDQGCRLTVLQTGFIGAPAALRCQALHASYRRLFGTRLPRLLDRLASLEATGAGRDWRWQAGDPRRQAATVALRAAAPRRRNTMAAGWAAGRAVGGGPPRPGAPVPGAPQPGVRRPVPSVGSGGVDRPYRGPVGGPPTATRAGVPTRRGNAPRSHRLRRHGLPGWAHAAVVGTAAAVAAAAVLSGVVRTTGIDADREIAGSDAERELPGFAVQPEATGSGDPAAPTAVNPTTGGPVATAPTSGEAGRLTAPPVVALPAPPPTPSDAGNQQVAVPSTGSPDTGSPDTSQSRSAESVVPSEPADPPVLTAALSTAGLPLLGGRAVRITVANPGPGTADDWELAVRVMDQPVSGVTGADYRRDGDQVLLTPKEPELPAGDRVEVSFQIHAPLLGLLGARDPTGCSIDGRPCR